jgi:hypothetical protein
MSRHILRHLPLVLAVAVTFWAVWIGIRIWTTPVVWEVVAAQTPEEAARQPPTRVREVRSFAEMSPLGYIPLAIPVILAAGAAVIASLRAPGCLAGVVVLFLGYVFITGFSIGTAYYGPATLLGITVLADVVLSWIERRRMADA